MPEPTEGEELSKGAKNGPGKIGETVVKGLKALGEADAKLKNAPKAIGREAKGAVKKGRKLVGLANGGFLTGTSDEYITKGLQDRMGVLSTTPLTPAPVVEPPPVPATMTYGTVSGGSTGAMGRGDGSGGGSGTLGQAVRKDRAGGGNLWGMKSGGYIRKGLDSMAKGGFITMKGPRKGSKGVAGKRMPKKGVMA